MPVPRRFDRHPPERDTTRINERIRVPEVRLIDEDGQQVGDHAHPRALRLRAGEGPRPRRGGRRRQARRSCRILDYSKYKYEQAQKPKSARKHQQQINVREIKFRPKIAQHDYDTKKGHVERFLKARDKVKVTIMFRGREMAHPERGRDDPQPARRGARRSSPSSSSGRQQDGRNMTMMLGRRARHAGRPATTKPLQREPTRSLPMAEPVVAADGSRPARSAKPSAGAAQAGTGGYTAAARHAQDEDPLRREEALQGHRHRQGAGAATPSRATSSRRSRRSGSGTCTLDIDLVKGDARRASAAAERERPMTRVKRSVHARKKRREALERTKGFRGRGQLVATSAPRKR